MSSPSRGASRAILAVLVCVVLGVAGGGRTAVTLLAVTSDVATVVYRPAPGGSGPSLVDAPPLDGAVVSGRIVLGVRGVAAGAVRYDLHSPTAPQGSAATGTLTARDATTVVVLDTATLDDGRWTLTATSTGQAGAGPPVSAAFTVRGPASSAPGPEPTDRQPPAEQPPGGQPPTQAPDASQAAITRSGSTIMRGGQPWWFLGYDSFVWSGDCGAGNEKMNPQQVDAWFSSMRHDGHGAVRLFFYKGWNQQALDQAIASAKRNNVYVTITLDDAIGGCATSKKSASWFSDQASTSAYQQHMTDLVGKYKGNPTIAWFEYFNEPTNAGGALRGFYDKMGAAAKQIDPNRLFSAGTLAPYDTGGAGGYQQINASPGVDIASLHEYDESEAESNHGPEARQNSAGKPVIVGEVGIKGCGGSDGQRATRFKAKAAAYTSTQGYAGMLAWAWGKRSGCDYENLDADTATQTVLRTAGPASPAAGSSSQADGGSTPTSAESPS